jgi:hypothetical protein
MKESINITTNYKPIPIPITATTTTSKQQETKAMLAFRLARHLR